MTTYIHCRAGGEIGMGHAVRCAHLARVLIDAGEDCQMVVIEGEPTQEYFKQLGLSCLASTDTALLTGFELLLPYRSPLDHNKNDAAGERWIVDVMINNDELLRRLRKRAKQLVVIVGVGYSITRDTHWIADQVIYQAPTGRWKGIPGERVIAGLNNIIIDPAYAEKPTAERDLSAVIYFGGGIPRSFSKEVESRVNALGISWRRLENWPGGVRPHMWRARAFIGSMGMAVYEAFASGVWPIVVCRSDDHLIPATRFDAQQRLKCLGNIDHVEPTEVAEELRQWLQDHLAFTPDMGARPVDGLGVYRVANSILEWKPRQLL